MAQFIRDRLGCKIGLQTGDKSSSSRGARQREPGIQPWAHEAWIPGSACGGPGMTSPHTLSSATSSSAAAMALRSSAVSGGCGGTGSPTA
jgi:hypothetical protein